MSTIKVVKRDGRKQVLDTNQFRKQTIPATEGLENVSYEQLELDISMLIRDEIPSTELQELLIAAALNRIDVDAAHYTYVAARLSIYDLYHRIKREYGVSGSGDVYSKVSMHDYINHNRIILSGWQYKYSDELIETFNTHIVGERDNLFDYLGFVTCRDRYLAKKEGVITELPQHMHMAIAMFLMQDEDPIIRKSLVIETYDALSKLEYINPTPMNSNGRLNMGGLISCLLGTVPDTIEEDFEKLEQGIELNSLTYGIFDTLKEVGCGSKIGSGWGIDWSRVRSQGGRIGNKPNAAGGKIPFIKIFNDLALAVDQNGDRPGAFAVYIECWDTEVFDFIDLKKKNGDDRRRAQDLFLGLSMCDLFMERDEADGDWTLFDPADVPELTETWGEEFEKHYVAYEADFKANPENYNVNTRTIKAVDLIREIAISYNNEGQPFMFFKDTVNREHKHPELGMIRSANLCTEVMQPVSEERTAVCNLGAINLARVNKPEDIKRVVWLAMRCMDNSIDLTPYPSKKAKIAQQERRSVGLGSVGEAELLANLGIEYGSEEHCKFIGEIWDIIERESDAASVSLGKEKGFCINGVDRNAYKRAIAPNSTSGLFAGTTNSHEAVYDTIWVEENKMGTYLMTAPNLNINNYAFYKNPYEIDIYKQIDACAVKQQRIDMGISFNIYLKPEGLKASNIRSVIRYAWKKKLKTTYYLRSKPPKKNAKKSSSGMACFGCTN